MTDIYTVDPDEFMNVEVPKRRSKWVEEGKVVEVYPTDCPMVSHPGCLPLKETTGEDDGRLRVMFLHGLESSALGMKPIYLNRWYRVCAPAMIPKRPFLTLRRVTAAIRSFRPHLIIGSSYGGAVLLTLLQHGEWSGPSILLAPALGLLAPYSLSLPKGLKAPIVLVHGNRDTLVPLAHSKQLLSSASGRSTVTVNCCDSTEEPVRSPAEVLAKITSAEVSLLITDDIHPLQKICCEEDESPVVPTLHAIIEEMSKTIKDVDTKSWIPQQPSTGFTAALCVCSNILWQYPTHLLTTRCCPNDSEPVSDLSRVGAEANAMKQAEESKKDV